MTFKTGDKVRLTGPSWVAADLLDAVVTVAGVDTHGNQEAPFIRILGGAKWFIHNQGAWEAELVEAAPEGVGPTLDDMAEDIRTVLGNVSRVLGVSYTEAWNILQPELLRRIPELEE